MTASLESIDFDVYEKKQDDSIYRVDGKQFGKILSDLISLSNSLALINSALSKAGKGSYLMFPDPTDPEKLVPFNKKDLRSAYAKFSKSMMLLKNYHRVSKKKTRKPVPPSSFSGTYTPVYAGDALIAFFKDGAAGFGTLNPQETTKKKGQNLMDSLEMVKSGYLLRNTSTMLFYIYAHTNSLQDPENAQFARSDKVMMKAFGGSIPALFVNVKDAEGKNTKLSMANAISQGLIKGNGLNTFDAIRKTNDSFDPERFNTYFYQNIAALNYYSKTALLDEAANDESFNEILESLYSEDVKNKMLEEHNLVKSVSDKWHEMLEPERKSKRDARKQNKKTTK